MKRKALNSYISDSESEYSLSEGEIDDEEENITDCEMDEETEEENDDKSDDQSAMIMKTIKIAPLLSGKDIIRNIYLKNQISIYNIPHLRSI